ncbi:MAG TPA: VOC family protein, partial [Acidimicrobiales bacterium]
MTVTTTRHRCALPFLYYADVAAAIAWLCDAFGFSERLKLAAPNGFVAHAELELGDAVVAVGGLGPRNAGPPPDRVRSGVYVFVDDVDAHCAHARAKGAGIAVEPMTTDYGEEYWSDRCYLAVDPEGHHWWFMQRMRG